MRLLHQRNPSHQKPYHAKHNRNTRLFKTSEEYGICRDIKTQRAEQSCMGNKSQQENVTENARHIHNSAGRRKELSYPAYETHFLLKSTKFRAPAISQKRILCETSFKNGNEVAQFKSIVPAMKRGTLMSPNIAQATKSATPMSPTFCHATKRPSSIAKYNAPVASDAPQPPNVFFSVCFFACCFLWLSLCVSFFLWHVLAWLFL